MNMYRNTYRIAELIVKKAGNEHPAGKIRYSMVDAAGQHLLQLAFLQVIFAEGQAIEPFIALVVGEIHLVAQGCRTEQIFLNRIRVIFNKGLQANGHFGELGIVLRFDCGLIIGIGNEEAQHTADYNHRTEQQAHSYIQRLHEFTISTL
ncbi:hypothetical protein D3C75_741030 [compost metagenome]